MFENKIDSLIQRVASLQSWGDSVHDNFFSEGIFPAYRHNKYWFYRRPDSNIFFTGIIVFTLNQMKENLSAVSQKIVEEITEKAVKNYPDFQNKDGLKTYNFYQTKPTNHFPNGLIFKHLKHFQLPDDIDDTAIIYLTSSSTKEEAMWLKDKLIQHANLTKFIIKNTFPHYQHLKVYSTWFGKNMPIEFDVCALCNLMYLIFKHQLPLNEFDCDTLKFLQSVILNDEFLTNPFVIAHNYATSPLIIYHYARLMTDFTIPKLEICREKLRRAVTQLLNNESITFNKVILSTSLMKLATPMHPLSAKEKKLLSISLEEENQHGGFRFFIAGLLSSYENPLLHYLANKKFTQIKWHCEAHNLTLLAENLALQKQFATKKFIS